MRARNILTGLLAAMLVALSTLTGCSGQPSDAASPTVAPVSDDPTVTIDGRQYGCEEVLGLDANATCGPYTQRVLEKYGDRIEDYVHSPNLGLVGDAYEQGVLRLSDVVYTGVTACVLRLQNTGVNQYLSMFREDAVFKRLHLGEGAYRTTWEMGGRQICSDLQEPDPDSGLVVGTGDKITP